MSTARISKKANNKVGEYSLVSKFLGYNARQDQTTVGPATLVSPSQNVLLGTSGRIGLVNGYTIDGSASTVIDSGIISNYDFENTTGGVRNLRCGFLTNAGNDGKLQYRYVDPSGDISWINLLTGLTSVNLNFCDYWDKINFLKNVLWVDGSSNIYAWNGAVTTFASAASLTNTIVNLSSTPNNGGSGYSIGDMVTISGGTGGTAQVTGTNAGGGITTYAIATGYAGSGYIVGDIVTLPVGFGQYATFEVATIGSGGSVASLTLTNSGSQSYTTGLYRAYGGTGASLFISVTAVATAGQVTQVQLLNGGSGYSVGTGNATTGGTGTGLTVNIVSIGSGFSITKQGTTSWIQSGFLPIGSITIGGTTAIYAGGASTTTLTVVSNDFTGTTIGSEIHQTPTITQLSSMTDIPSTFTPTCIGCGRQNQIYLGSKSSNELYISQVNNYLSYAYSTPTRLVGEGYMIALDAPPIGFISLENRNDTNAFDLYISEGKDIWGLVRSTLSSDLTSEKLEVMRMKVTPKQGAQSQKLISKMKNHIIYVGYDNTANFLGYISYQNVPETVDFGYTIINDLNSYDYTDGQIFYYKNYIYIAIPKEGIVRVFNMTDQTKQTTSSIRGVEDVDADQPWFWEAPITYPVSGFFITEDGSLGGHGYNGSESYILFNGGSFNGQDIDAVVALGYDDMGDRTQSKGSNELWVDGYIGQNTIITSTVNEDLGAFQVGQTTTINGSDNTIVAYGGGGHSLGEKPFGSSPLGGASITTNENPLPAYFHVIKTYTQNSYYLEQIYFETKGVDLQWELISFGTNKSFTTEGNNSITQ